MLNRIKCGIAFLRGFVRAKVGPWRSKKNIEHLQNRLIGQFIRNTLSNSPYYRQYHTNDIAGFPVIDKAFAVSHFNDINTQALDREHCIAVAEEAELTRNFHSPIKGFSVGLSSGTSGKRGLFVTSDAEQSEWAGYIISKMLPFRLYKQKVAFLLRSNNHLYERAQGLLIDFNFFDLLRPTSEIIRSLEMYAPDILIAPAQVLLVLVEEKVKLKPSKVISVAEVLEVQDQHKIEQYFQVKVHQVYQCTEGFIAATCSHGNLHVNEDVVKVEKDWIDRASGRFSPIITDLRRSTQPVVRYRLDDILVEDAEPCTCGSKFMRLKAIEGRCDDILWSCHRSDERLIALFPDVIRRTMLMAQEYFEDYRIIQEGTTLKILLKTSTKNAVMKVRASLMMLFDQLEVRTLQCDFLHWTDNDVMIKRRRVKCQIKPTVEQFETQHIDVALEE